MKIVSVPGRLVRDPATRRVVDAVGIDVEPADLNWARMIADGDVAIAADDDARAAPASAPAPDSTPTPDREFEQDKMPRAPIPTPQALPESAPEVDPEGSTATDSAATTAAPSTEPESAPALEQEA